MNLPLQLKSLLLVGAIVLATMAAGQTQPAPGELVIRATTRMVSLDAVVNDHDGRAVTDLTRNDFTVIEDGKLQALGLRPTSRHQRAPLPWGGYRLPPAPFL